MSDPGLAGEETVVAAVVAEVACCGHAVGHQGYLPLKTSKHIKTVEVHTAATIAFLTMRLSQKTLMVGTKMN